MLMILRKRLKAVMSGHALCPAQVSSETPIRDDRRHWPSSVCLSLPDPWSRVAQLHQPVRDLFFRQPQPVVRTQTSRLSTDLQLSSDMLHCDFAVVLAPFSGTGIPGQPSLRPHGSKSALRR